jgi:hypothetical protein
MLFTAYVDESDTHGAAPHMVMGAHLATGRQWELFERGFRRLKRDYGFTVLHGVEFRTQAGEFVGWSYEKCKSLLNDLGRLQAGNLTETITVNLKYTTYKEHFLDIRPKKMHATSQYGICFEAILAFFCGYLLSERKSDRPRLSIVVESGHHNAPDTARIFDEFKEELSAAGIDLLRTHSLVNKKDSYPLMVIDVGVYGSARLERAVREGTYERSEKVKPKKGKPGWTSYEITPDKLAHAIERYNISRARAHADYANRKAAYEAKKATERQSS